MKKNKIRLKLTKKKKKSDYLSKSISRSLAFVLDLSLIISRYEDIGDSIECCWNERNKNKTWKKRSNERWNIIIIEEMKLWWGGWGGGFFVRFHTTCCSRHPTFIHTSPCFVCSYFALILLDHSRLIKQINLVYRKQSSFILFFSLFFLKRNWKMNKKMLDRLDQNISIQILSDLDDERRERENIFFNLNSHHLTDIFKSFI